MAVMGQTLIRVGPRLEMSLFLEWRVGLAAKLVCATLWCLTVDLASRVLQPHLVQWCALSATIAVAHFGLF